MFISLSLCLCLDQFTVINSLIPKYNVSKHTNQKLPYTYIILALRIEKRPTIEKFPNHVFTNVQNFGINFKQSKLLYYLPQPNAAPIGLHSFLA